MLSLVLNSSLHWKQNGSEDGISIPWTQISLHATQNDPQKCIYLMLDFELVWPGVHDAGHRNGNGNAEVEEDDDEDEGHVEGRSFLFLIINR